MNARFAVPSLFVAALVVAACASRDERAGAAAPAKNAEAARGGDEATLAVPQRKQEDREPQPVTPATEPPMTGSTTGTTPVAPSPSPAAEPPDAPRRREVALRSARAEVDQAQRDLDASMSDCQAACRALGSMERATGHLCDLATERDDRRRCEDAKTAVLRAREKIRAHCTTCPGGPSLEKSAPIPSRP